MSQQLALPFTKTAIPAATDISLPDPRSSNALEPLYPRAAEFFAGIGLVRQALETASFRVVFANDIEPKKRAMYALNFDASHFLLGDIRDVTGADVPDIDLATASFPCTDLSLAGWRRGLEGDQSGMFWQFARVLREMGNRRPFTVLLENVPGFATSRNGDDLRAAISELNNQGYWCDVIVVDARHFVPQSRPRLFVVGAREPLTVMEHWQVSDVRPAWLTRFVLRHPELQLNAFPLALPDHEANSLAAVVEHLPPSDGRWWDNNRLARFVDSLSSLQKIRLDLLKARSRVCWAAAYRRTRGGSAVWEIRADELSGCLRAVRGGSSKQALVEAGTGELRVRWMTPREYARLQGAPGYTLPVNTRESQALFGFGDAVCVPVVAWLAQTYLKPLVDRKLTLMSLAAYA